MPTIPSLMMRRCKNVFLIPILMHSVIWSLPSWKQMDVDIGIPVKKTSNVFKNFTLKLKIVLRVYKFIRTRMYLLYYQKKKKQIKLEEIKQSLLPFKRLFC